MDLADIAVFVEAVQTGSLAGAARRLQASPMIASRRLAALEKELGIRLLHRSTRALALTAEGEAFLPYAQAMLEDEAAARAAVRPSAAGLSGVLRISASLVFGRKHVTPAAVDFMRAHPDLRVELNLSDSMFDIVAEGYDLAIRIAQLRDSSLIARRIADNPRSLYAAPAYVAEHGLPRRLADLADHECLTLPGMEHWPFRAGGRAVRRRVGGRFTANSLDALHQACLDGLGICVLSHWATEEEVTAGLLVPVPLEDADPDPLGIWAIYPTARLVPPKVRLFVTAMQARMNPR